MNKLPTVLSTEFTYGELCRMALDKEIERIDPIHHNAIVAEIELRDYEWRKVIASNEARTFNLGSRYYYGY